MTGQTVSFLRSLGTGSISWEFRLVSGRALQGRVIDYMSTPDGVPVSILLATERGNTDVVWRNVETVTKVEGDNNA